MLHVWFWQRMVSPHIAFLAMALAKRGVEVRFVAETAISEERAMQGWQAPRLEEVELSLLADEVEVEGILDRAPTHCIHICEGIRKNGIVGIAQKKISRTGGRQWILMETVQDKGWYGFLKRLEYRRIFRKNKRHISGILAIGHRTAGWVANRGVNQNAIFPFAYFLENKKDEFPRKIETRRSTAFRFLYAGQLVERKRVEWIISALEKILPLSFELLIVGKGNEEASLRHAASKKLHARVHWLGQLSLPEVPSIIRSVDCLVLASTHDGWGAVVSEALIQGTPVVCSDACGAAEVVKFSGVGGVFQSNSLEALTDLLRAQVLGGSISNSARSQLAAWAACLTSEAGAEYLEQILQFCSAGESSTPKAPWISK